MQIGALMGYAEGDPEGQQFVAAFEQGLRALGWTPGQNLRIDYRWGGGEAERFQAHAAELVAAAPRAIFAHSSSAVRALAQQTRKIPVVFANIADPLGQGFVASLARPGGNITGFPIWNPGWEKSGWRRSRRPRPTPCAPPSSTIRETAPYFEAFWEALTAAAPAFSIRLINAPAREIADIDAAMVALGREPGGGLIVMPDVFTSMKRNEIVALAARHRLPAVYPLRFFATGGGLMSYGADTGDIFRRAAGYMDRVLKGANPGELPVQTPTKFQLVVNLKRPRRSGLTCRR